MKQGRTAAALSGRKTQKTCFFAIFPISPVNDYGFSVLTGGQSQDAICPASFFLDRSHGVWGTRMMEVASTKNFRIAVDLPKNRLYLIVSGDALKANENLEAPAFVEKACAQLKPGFTCLADHTQLSLFGLPDVAAQIMSAMMRAGLRKVASVWPSESFAKIVVKSTGEQTGDSYTAKRKFFSDLGSAEAWLDE
jgi:hypothetical protein